MSGRDDEGVVSELSAEERAYAEAEIDAALAPYQGRLSADELAWMRATLATGIAGGAMARLARAAYPREVDESGEIFRGPLAAGTVPVAAVATPGRRR